MNFFGHAAVARLRQPEAPFVFGAMLPDLINMARIGRLGRTSREVGDGVLFHHQTDALFHDTQAFGQCSREALARLRSCGVSRGPARAGAHVGVEMLIDSCLAQSGDALRCYLASLEWAAGSNASELGTPPSDAQKLRALAELLIARGPRALETSRQRLVERLGRVLGHRPRLAPQPWELASIADVCAELRPEVERLVPGLLEELTDLWAPRHRAGPDGAAESTESTESTGARPGVVRGFSFFFPPRNLRP